MAQVSREGLPGEIRRRQDAARREWDKYPGLQRFLEDHFPYQWEKIQTCGTGYHRTYESIQRPGTYKATPVSCWQVPYCILCTRLARWRRLRATLDQFSMCTPAGKEPRFIHIVQTAPLTGDGLGWGKRASEDLQGFGRVVWNTLQDSLGDGLGAVMSYHDFGERGPIKRHPHYDLTLNGWRLEDGEPALTPTLDLKGTGRKRWDELIVKHAQRIEIGARRGNLDVLSPRTGVASYWKILQYQMRELMDLRKLTYNAEKQEVYWNNYHGGQQKYTAGDFICHLYEYRNRLGTWGAKPSQELHRRYGHLSKRSIRATQRITGGQPQKHPENCPCTVCSDWDRVFLEEVEEGMHRRLTAA